MRSFSKMQISPSLEGITEIFWQSHSVALQHNLEPTAYAVHYPKHARMIDLQNNFAQYQVVWPGDAQILINLWDDATGAFDIPFYESRASVFRAQWLEAFPRTLWHKRQGN